MDGPLGLISFVFWNSGLFFENFMAKFASDFYVCFGSWILVHFLSDELGLSTKIHAFFFRKSNFWITYVAFLEIYYAVT